MNIHPKKCHYCDNPAIFICDFIVNRTTRPGSCDRALCNDHRRKIGHICDRSRRTTNNQSDTIDNCPEHAP